VYARILRARIAGWESPTPTPPGWRAPSGAPPAVCALTADRGKSKIRPERAGRAGSACADRPRPTSIRPREPSVAATRIAPRSPPRRGMNPQDLPLRAAGDACRAETAKFWRREASNDAFCLELFRRAICEADAAAWESVFDVYRSLVAVWIKNHPAAAVAAEE